MPERIDSCVVGTAMAGRSKVNSAGSLDELATVRVANDWDADLCDVGE